MDPQVAAKLPALAWLLGCSALVFFMQAGFAAVESGAVRYKNSINVALKNVIDLCCSFAAYFVVGYSLMFGASLGVAGWGLVGTPGFFLDGIKPFDPAGTDVYLMFPLAGFLFQVTFCNTAATIVSGGVAERCRFMAYVLVSFGIGLVIYPIYGHWVWGGGWLSRLGFHDFAGSSVVHVLGAGLTLAGIQALGARAGRYGPDGKPRPIPASSMPLVALGVCFLAFGWIGFNGGSAELGVHTATIIINTLNAGCFGGLAVMLIIWAMRGVPEADLILNGVLGGLVAVTASADIIALPASAVIGLIGGAAVLVGTRLLDRLRLDDAVGAVPVHGFAGAAGVLCTALFADAGWLTSKQLDRWHFLGIQAIGLAACVSWGWLSGSVLWWVVGRFTALRIGPAEEAVGMNYSEHKVGDPVLELTAALTDHLRGEERSLRLDDVREGDLVPLARVVEQLADRLSAQRRENRAWEQAVNDLRSRLHEQHSQGARAAGVSLTDLDDCRSSLGNVLAFLDQHRDEHVFVPLLHDLVRQLQARLGRAASELPRVQAALDSVRADADRLHQTVLAQGRHS